MPKTAKQKAANLAWYHRNRVKNLGWQKDYRKRIKDACFAAYGGYICNCCKESQEKFLTLDHIGNDGNVHRKQIGYRGGPGLYLWIIRNEFPPLFQVLCFNCNHGKHLNGGVCPHQTSVTN